MLRTFLVGAAGLLCGIALSLGAKSSAPLAMPAMAHDNTPTDIACNGGPQGPVSLRLMAEGAPALNEPLTLQVTVTAHEALASATVTFQVPGGHPRAGRVLLHEGPMAQGEVVAEQVELLIPSEDRLRFSAEVNAKTVTGFQTRESERHFVDLGEDDRLLAGEFAVGPTTEGQVRRIQGRLLP